MGVFLVRNNAFIRGLFAKLAKRAIRLPVPTKVGTWLVAHHRCQTICSPVCQAALTACNTASGHRVLPGPAECGDG